MSYLVWPLLVFGVIFVLVLVWRAGSREMDRSMRAQQDWWEEKWRHGERLKRDHESHGKE